MSHYVELPSGTVLETDSPEIWPEAKKLSRKVGKERLKAEAIEYLRDALKPGDTVYTVLRHVSRSGMTRNIDCYVFTPNERGSIDKLYLSGYVARAVERTKDDNGIKMGGCGMDMGFALVYELGYALWPKGTTEPHGMRNGKPDTDGGCALKQEWI